MQVLLPQQQNRISGSLNQQSEGNVVQHCQRSPSNLHQPDFLSNLHELEYYCQLCAFLALMKKNVQHFASHHLSSHLSLNRKGRWGTTDDFTTGSLHFSLFSTALWDLANSRPSHSLMLSSHLFPLTVPCKMILARPDEQETCPYHCSLRLFTIVRRSLCGPIACWILAQTSSVTWSCYLPGSNLHTMMQITVRVTPHCLSKKIRSLPPLMPLSRFLIRLCEVFTKLHDAWANLCYYAKHSFPTLRNLTVFGRRRNV